jgi:hypothetical protein
MLSSATLQPRPTWSVMIPTYNCANYLRETLASVLAQDLGADQMQIQVVDDHSTQDDPKAVVDELGGRVEFYQQPHNVGLVSNLNTCLQRSQGHLVHVLHGDDCVRPGFYSRIQTLFEQYPQVGAAYCRHIYMDEEGHWQGISTLEQTASGVLSNWLEYIASGQRLVTPAIAVRRAVYEKLGGFDQRFTVTGEDWEMWVRIATQYAIAYEVEPLALYRLKRSGSLTQQSERNGQFVRDLYQATQIVESYLVDYLPQPTVKVALKQARRMFGGFAMHGARQSLEGGDVVAALQQIKVGLEVDQSSMFVKDTMRLMMKTFLWNPIQTLHFVLLQHTQTAKS